MRFRLGALRSLLLPVFIGVSATTAFSADESVGSVEGFNTNSFDDARFYVGGGIDNVFEGRGADAEAYFMVEYASEIINPDYGVRWRVGVDGSEIGIWGGAGLSAEHVFANSPYYIEGSLMAGIYEDLEEQDQLDLGHSFEIRSQIAVGYHFGNGYDLAVGISHKSNAGLSDDNPGLETVFVRLGVGLP